MIAVEQIDNLFKSLDDPAAADDSKGKNAASLALLGKKPTLRPELNKWVIEHIEEMVRQLTARMPLPSVTAQGRRITAMVARFESIEEIKKSLQELKNRLFDELCEREFLYVPQGKARYYKEAALFGKEVNDRFPKAIDDIEEAGKCLALGQGTACVLHTMRVMECGLRALASSFGIPYAPSWESYLRQVSDKIAQKHKNKTAKWRREEKFYRDLSGDLLTVKQVWRNPTMHVDRKYSPDEAEQIFIATRAFMERLAGHFTEKEMAKLLR